MHIGCVKERKNREYRVGLTPESVSELVQDGHTVSIEAGAGIGSGCTDAAYQDAGATVMTSLEAVYAAADLIIKVKEPQPEEFALMRPGQVLFTYLHLAAEPAVTLALQKQKVVAIAYETVRDATGGLPLLAPMSEVAGRVAVQIGAHFLEKQQGGSGILLGGAIGTLPAHVVILGGGMAGSNAARIALGMGADVTIVDTVLPRLGALEDLFHGQVRTVYSTQTAIASLVKTADLLIGSVLIPGAKAPGLVSDAMVATMRPGSVIVDLAIDQGGCVATMHPTTLEKPVFERHGVLHYGVPNIPSIVAQTATFELGHATLPFIRAIAEKGWQKAASENPFLAEGLNVIEGAITNAAVAAALGKPYTPYTAFLPGHGA